MKNFKKIFENFGENTVRGNDKSISVRRDEWDEETYPWADVISGKFATVKYKGEDWIVDLDLSNAQSVRLTYFKGLSNFQGYNES